jgi:hypothetical protein
VFILLLAALDNLREHAVEEDLEAIGFSMTDQQREFLQHVCELACRVSDQHAAGEPTRTGLPSCRYDEDRMELKTGLHHVSATDLDEIVRGARLGGWTLFELDGRQICDRPSFFDSIRDSLPTDPPLSSNRSWDALSDSLWGGLDVHPAMRILIVWRDAHRMAAAAAADQAMALEMLEELALSLGRPEDTDGRPKMVCVLVQR